MITCRRGSSPLHLFETSAELIRQPCQEPDLKVALTASNSISTTSLDLRLFNAMADSKAALNPSIPPPSYDDAAVQHGALPSRPNPSGKLPPRGPLPLDIPILQLLKGKRVILASASPRRKHLLATVNFPLYQTQKPKSS